MISERFIKDIKEGGEIIYKDYVERDYAEQLQQEKAALKAELEAVKENNKLLEAANAHYKLIMFSGDSVNKIKADAIREAIKVCDKHEQLVACTIFASIEVEDLEDHANRIEAG